LILPYLNFAIATSALVFQTTVLYPWHHELDAEFKVMRAEFSKVTEAFSKVKAEQEEMLHSFHEVKLRRIEDLEKAIHKRGWFW
jgi:hypothetical protein